MRPPTAWFRSVLIFAGIVFCLRAAAADLYVAPGDTGRLLLSVENDSQSEAPVKGVKVSISEHALFSVELPL